MLPMAEWRNSNEANDHFWGEEVVRIGEFHFLCTYNNMLLGQKAGQRFFCLARSLHLSFWERAPIGDEENH